MRHRRIVFAFSPAGEAGKSVFLAQRADAVATAGEDLVRIALVADIEDQPVVRRVEHLVDGDRQFDDTEACTQMSARAGHRVDHLVANFARKLRQFTIIHLAKVGGKPDLIEQRRYGKGCHGSWPSLFFFEIGFNV